MIYYNLELIILQMLNRSESQNEDRCLFSNFCILWQKIIEKEIARNTKWEQLNDTMRALCRLFFFHVFHYFLLSGQNWDVQLVIAIFEREQKEAESILH